MTAQLPVQLRYYQKDGADAFSEYLKINKTGNGVIVLPTGTGKSYLLAELIRRYAGDLSARVLVVTHTKKIVQQDYDSTVQLWPEGKKLFGINSDGLGRRDTKHQVIFCGIQSVYKHAKVIGKVNFMIIDEAQRVNLETSVQYKRFIKEMLEINPQMRVCGLTATPYRMGTGLIYGPSKSLLFDDLVYQANTKELIVQGYIAKPVLPKTFDKNNLINREGVALNSYGDFNETQLEKRVISKSLIGKQIDETLKHCQGLNSIAVFCVSIKHAEKVADELKSRNESVAVIHSEIEGDDEKLIQQFEEEKVRFLISVNMFVEGFDCPNIQAIVDLKPTLSPGRYVQMYGRGFRLCERIGKKTFLVLDFAGNIGYHGPVDQVSPTKEEEKLSTRMPEKECKACGRICHARHKVCPYCGAEFPKFDAEREDKTLETFSRISLISEPKWFSVIKLHCAQSKHRPTILAHYYSSEGNKFSAEIAYDEDGKKWLHDHLGENIPFDITNFFNGGYRSKIKQPVRIFVDEAGSSSKILKYEFKS